MQTRPFLWLLAGLGVLLCGWIAWPFLGAILTAATLAVALAPLDAALRRRVRSRSLSSFLTVVVFVTAVVVPVVLVALAVTDDVKRLTSGAIDLAWLDRLMQRAGWTGAEFRGQLQDQLLASSRSLLGTAASVAAGIGGSIVSAFISLFTLYFFLKDGSAWLREIMRWAPLERSQRDRLVDVIHQTVLANVYGVLAVSLAQGSLALLGFWLSGVPSPVLWAVVTGFFSLIPLLGSAAVWLPAMLFLYAQGHTGSAVFLAIWSGGLVSWADNVVRPYVISEKVRINPLLILLSLLGGVQAFGLVGLFVGPVIVALTGAVFQILRESTTKETATKEASAA